MNCMGELGSWLIRAREARGLTIEDAERDTRISRRYLQALESEQYEVIPAPVYARGFLRSYSQYLGLDPVEMLELFPRDDDSPAPVIGTRSGNVGVGTPQASRQQPDQPKPSMKSPAPAQSAARPTWRVPGRSNQQQQTPMPKRPPNRRQAPAAQFEDEGDDHIVIGATAAAPAPRRSAPPPPAPARQQSAPQNHEPTIGIDIGVIGAPAIGSVPMPQRKLQQDSAAPARNLTVVGVAVGAIILVVALAFIISRVGGGDVGGPDADPTSSATINTSRDATAQAAATQGSTGTTTGVTPGIVPMVEGMTVERARAAILEAGFKVNETREKSTTTPRNVVSMQAPGPGGSLSPGQSVIIVVSDGP